VKILVFSGITEVYTLVMHQRPLSAVPLNDDSKSRVGKCV